MLEWELEWGEKAEELGRIGLKRIQEGREPVKALVNKPELHERLERFYDAFWALDSDRSVTMGGATRIPWRSIDAYAIRYGFEGEDFRRLEYLLRKMDTAYLRRLKGRRSSGGNNK